MADNRCAKPTRLRASQLAFRNRLFKHQLLQRPDLPPFYFEMLMRPVQTGYESAPTCKTIISKLLGPFHVQGRLRKA